MRIDITEILNGRKDSLPFDYRFDEGALGDAEYALLPEDIKLCDLRNGTLYTLREDMIEDAGEDIVRLKNLPLLDSPLAILMK